MVLTIRTDRLPYVSKLSRIDIDDLSQGFYESWPTLASWRRQLSAKSSSAARSRTLSSKGERPSFFLGREILVCTNKPGMARWHKSLYSAMSRVAQRPAEFFKLPVNRTVELGQRVEF